MGLYLYIEPDYLSSSWCGEILAGISAEKKRKRIKIHTVGSIDDIPKDEHLKNSSVILVGTKHKWISDNIDAVEKLNMNPILLCNTHQNGIHKKHSTVSSDVFGALKTAMELLHANKKTKVALYGINPDSKSDAMRQNAFLTFGGSKHDVFYNNGLLLECFNAFYPHIEHYNAVICANEFAAVSLVHRLKIMEFPIKNISIISCTDSLLCKNFSPSITSLAVRFDSFGKAAIALHETLSKNIVFSTINCLIDYTVCHRETPADIDASILPSKTNFFDSESDVNIYKDPELTELIAVDTFLRNCEKDPLDLKIIKMLEEKQTVEVISEKTFFSVSAIKYRIKNLCKLFRVEKISELLTLIKKYL